MPYKLHIAIGIIFVGLMSGCTSAPKVLTELEVEVCPPTIQHLDCPYSDSDVDDPKAGDSLPNVLNKYYDLKYMTLQCKEAVDLRDRAWKRCKRLSKERK